MPTIIDQAKQKTKEMNSTTAPTTHKSGNIDRVSAEIQIQNQASPPLSKAAHEPPRWLTVSPYLEQEHLLDLKNVDMPNRLLALALTELEPATPQYATTKYEEALDWDSLMFTLRSLVANEGYKWARHEFYVVEFRSKLKKEIDADLLFRLDKESHIEATASGGLLKYWYGVPDENRRNLATCEKSSKLCPGTSTDYGIGLWRGKDDAINGGKGPWHKQARAAIPNMYEQIDVKGLRLIIEDDVASWTFGQLA